MRYKDENTGWVYRVSPQPAERDLYFIEYLDPSNSVIFKRLPDYPGSKFKESAEEVLAARAQRNGWTPTAPPEIEPEGNDLSDVEEEKATERHGIITPEGEFFADGAPCRKSVLFRAQIDAGRVQAVHVCNEQPRNIKIWLNEFERPETWVMNKEGTVCGEFIDACPYCHANLKEGHGDVLFVPRRPLEEEDNTCPRQSALTGGAAATTTESAVKLLAGAEETSTTSESAEDASTLTGLNEKEIPEMTASIAVAVKPAANPAPSASDSTMEATVAGDCVPMENVDGVTAVSSSDGKGIDVPTGFEEGIATFDYEGLDNSTAQTVRANSDEFARHMLSSAEEYANACINAANVNKALSNHYHGKWGEWCAGFGLSNGAARRMVNIGRKLLSETKLVQLVSDGQIGKSLLQVMCSPNAPAELVQAVKDGEITTHKQYKELEAQLKETQERAERAEREAQEAKEKAHRLETRELYDANQRIKELENRPIEVATQAPTEEQINEAAKPVIQEMTAMYKVQLKQQREQIKELEGLATGAYNTLANTCLTISENLAGVFLSDFEKLQAMAQDLSEDTYISVMEPIFEACREICSALEGADYVEG